MLLTEFVAYLFVGMLSGLLAGLFGVGGGIVIVPALTLIFTLMEIGGDWTLQLAIGSSLATIIGTGLAATYAHQRRGAVRWELFAKLAPGIVIGAWVGSGLVAIIPQWWLQRGFAGFLAVVGVRMWLSSAPRVAQLPAIGALRSRAFWAIGSGIGMLSALVGIGGGTLTVPFLSGRGLELRQAVGTSAACGLPIALAGAIGFALAGWGRAELPAFSTGFVYWPAVGVMLLASIPAAPRGVQLAQLLPVAWLKRLFGLLLLAIALRLAISD